MTTPYKNDKGEWLIVEIPDDATDIKTYRYGRKSIIEYNRPFSTFKEEFNKEWQIAKAEDVVESESRKINNGEKSVVKMGWKDYTRQGHESVWKICDTADASLTTLFQSLNLKPNSVVLRKM